MASFWLPFSFPVNHFPLFFSSALRSVSHRWPPFKMAASPWDWDQRKERSSTWPTPTPEEVMAEHGTPLYFTAEPAHNGVSPHFMELSSPEFDSALHRHEEKPPLNISPEVARSTRPSCTSGTPEAKKPRNPWGEMSYADLITKAILSSQDQRLTLSEIYTWMIENVPYFHEKANETSTSGWKVGVKAYPLSCVWCVCGGWKPCQGCLVMSGRGCTL